MRYVRGSLIIGQNEYRLGVHNPHVRTVLKLNSLKKQRKTKSASYVLEGKKKKDQGAETNLGVPIPYVHGFNSLWNNLKWSQSRNSRPTSLPP